MVPTANASHTDANRESRTASLDHAKKNYAESDSHVDQINKKVRPRTSLSRLLATPWAGSVCCSSSLASLSLPSSRKWWYVARVSVWHTKHTDCRSCHIPIAPSPSSLTFLIGPPGCLSSLSGQHQIGVCPSPPLCIHSHFQSHIAKKKCS